MRELLLDGGREQPLVHADVDQPGLEAFVVERIHQLLVIHAPRILAQVLVGVVADGVALERVGLELLYGPVDLLQPAGLPRSEDGVRQHAARAGFLVDPGARRGLHLVGEEPVRRDIGRRAAETGDLGIAVEENLLDVVGELEVFQGLGFAHQRRVPAGLANRLAGAHEVLQARVIAQEVGMHVHDELLGERLGALVGHLRRGRFGATHRIERPIGVVHGDKGRRHPCRSREEGAPAHALLRAPVLRRIA